MRSQSAPSDFRSLPRAALHVFGLWGFWVAQPLYDLLGRNVAFLIAHGADAFTLVLLVAALSFVAPACLLVPVGLASLAGRRAGWIAHGFVAGGLFASMTLLLSRNAELLGEAAASGLALAVGVAGAAASIHLASWNRILSGLSIASFAFPVLFLVGSPLVRPQPSAGSAAAIAIESTTPVVLVVLDEFPLSSLLGEDGDIDRVRYPNLAAFADQSLWFREATAVASDTNLAVPAILTGRYPQASVAPILRRYPENLFTLLRGNGPMEAFEEITRLCPKEACNESRTSIPPAAGLGALLLDTSIVYLHLIAPPSVSSSLPPIDGSWSGFVEGARPGAERGSEVGALDPLQARYRGRWRGFGDLLESIRLRPEARLYFLHLLAPHAPWNTLPSGREFGPVELFPHGFAADRVATDPWEALQGLQRHLLQVGFVDRMLRDLFGALREAGLYDRALLIIASDHGSSFEPGQNRRYLTASNFADLLAVPLLVKLPGQREGETLDRLVETIDILPTIADVLDFEIPWQIDGHSLLDPGIPARRVKQAYHGRRLVYDPRAIARGRDRTAARIRSFFGSGANGLIAIGPHPELLGRAVRSLDFDERTEQIVVSLDRPEQFDRVDLTARSIPVHITGTLSMDPTPDEPVSLAIALNGKIAAVTQSYGHQRDAPAFSALVSEAALTAGRNRVEILRILETEHGLRVRSLPRNDERIDLLTRGAAELIRIGARELPVVAGSVTGTAVLSGGGITGVAARTGQRLPVDELVLFVDGQAIFRGRPGGIPDLIDEVAGASFRISLPSDWPDRRPAGRRGVRIFGLADGVAGELTIQYPRARGTRTR